MSRSRDIADILGRTEASNTTNVRLITSDEPVGLDSAQVQNVGTLKFTTLDSLPTTGLVSGQQAWVESSGRLYISNGSGWYNVALINATPTLTISQSGTVLFNNDTTSATITLTGADDDGPLSGLTYSVESDGNMHPTGTVLSQDSSVFTFTSLTEDSGAVEGAFTLTFKVSDGVAFATDNTQFRVSFGVNWYGQDDLPSLRTKFFHPKKVNANFGQSVAFMNETGTEFAVGGSGLYDSTATAGYGGFRVFRDSGSNIVKYQAYGHGMTQQSNYAHYNGAAATMDGKIYAITAWSEGVTYSGSGALIIMQRGSRDSDFAPANNVSGTDGTFHPAPAQSYSYYGTSVGLSGKDSANGHYRIVSGENGYDTPHSNAGRAWVHRSKDGDEWTLEQNITPTLTGTGNSYGSQCEIDSHGTVAAIVSTGGTSPGRGVNLWFRDSDSKTWTNSDFINYQDVPEAVNGDQLIRTLLSPDGLSLFVAAPYDDGPANNFSNQGVIYEWQRDSRNDNTFTGPTSKFYGPDSGITGHGSYAFGAQSKSFAVSRDKLTAVVGHYGTKRDSSSQTQEGVGYIFQRDSIGDDSWSRRMIHNGMFDDSSFNTSGNLGWSADISRDGKRVMFGAPNYDSEGGAVNNSGRVLFFDIEA